MIKKLLVLDFDGTLMNTPSPEEGKLLWSKYYNKEYPYIGWWSKPESLDLNVFDIKPIPEIYDIYLKHKNSLNTVIILMTNRRELLRNSVRFVLKANNIYVDELNMNKNNSNKGERLLRYVDLFFNIDEIEVYDDNVNDISNYESIAPILESRNIKYKFNHFTDY